MKITFTILTLGLLFNSYGQKYSALEKVLTKELSKESTKDGKWVFYSDKADIKKLDKSLVKAIIPTYDFYEVTLTNYLGYHVNQGTCTVLFDSAKSKIVLVEPLWYGGTSHSLIKLFIGKKIEPKDSLLSFLNQLNELMQVGSGYKFRQTSYSDSLATFDLGYFKGDSYTTGSPGISSTVTYHEDGVWRKIIIKLKNHAIIRYTEINPKTNDHEIIE